MANLEVTKDRFKEAYTNYMLVHLKKKGSYTETVRIQRKAIYFSLRSFIMDCGILTYNDLDLIELEINASLRKRGFNI